jgi:hypothetical protein
MRMGICAVVLGVLFLVGSAGAASGTVAFNFGTTGDVGYNLSTGAGLTFGHMKIVNSSYSDDLLNYIVHIGSMTVSTGTRTVSGDEVKYGFAAPTTTFQIFDPTDTTAYLSGTLHTNSLTIFNQNSMIIDGGPAMNLITSITKSSGATQGTVLDMVEAGQASFVMTLSAAAPTDFDAQLRNAGAAEGAVEGSVSAVPEPATFGLLGIGLAAMFSRRRKQASRGR